MRTKRRRSLLDLLPFLGAFLFACVALFLFLTHWSGGRKQLAVSDWEREIGPLAAVLEEHPVREANEVALALEQRVPALGIDIAPRTYRERAPRAEPGTYTVRGEVEAYLAAELSREGGRPGAPPPEFVTYLEAQRPAFERLIDTLLEGDPPKWELRLREGRIGSTEIPNMLGHLRLQRLLLAYTVERLHADDPPSALRAFEASWKLNAALREDPVLISQLVAVAITREQAGVLRLLEEPPAGWAARILEHDHRRSFLQALELEGWHLLEFDSAEAIGSRSKMRRVMGTLLRPYIRVCSADTIDELRRELTNLAELDHWCDRDLGAADADLELVIPWWNKVGEAVVPNLAHAIYRIARAEIELEMTSRLLAFRERRLETDGRRHSRSEPSSVCPGDAWVARIEPDGRWQFHFSRVPFWPDEGNARLPLRRTSWSLPQDGSRKSLRAMFQQLDAAPLRCPDDGTPFDPASTRHCASSTLNGDRLQRRWQTLFRKQGGRFGPYRNDGDWTHEDGRWQRRYRAEHATLTVTIDDAADLIVAEHRILDP